MLQYPENFIDFRKMKGHQVKLHADKSVKPKVVPERTTPYHLQERVDELLKYMLSDGIIEEMPSNEAATWISAATLAPKANGVMQR